ncbi:MAG TPA: response regulator [Thermoanaerobaculia bacterium]|nr:response regulator [Thermoanaerobaculia bacterium]
MRLEKRILIVDDDDAIRALLQTVLRRRGFRVDAARNGVEALERMATCFYALVVLDLMMPRMNGYEVLEHFATLAPTRRPLVLLLTAGLEPRKYDTTLVVGTMQKPFDIELLVDTISGCLTATMPQEQLDRCSDVADSTPAEETN